MSLNTPSWGDSNVILLVQKDSSSGVLTPQTTTNGAAPVVANSVNALVGGQSAAISISSTSAQSSAITTGFVTVTPTVDCFFRQGANPTSLSNGTDDFLLANNKYRISGVPNGNKLAFVTTGAAGTVYITPGG